MSTNTLACETKPLGLLGGTFDPIHFGHLRLAEEARELLGLGQVMLIPAGDPPHRDKPVSSAQQRLAMVQAAIADNPALMCDDGEVNQVGKSYTILTLQRLRERYPARPLVLILGADAFNGLHRWHRWREIFELAHIAVANRPGSPPHGRRWPEVLDDSLAKACVDRISREAGCLVEHKAGHVVPFDMTPLAISASLIRNLTHAGNSVRYLLPDPVLQLIQLHDLYH